VVEDLPCLVPLLRKIARLPAAFTGGDDVWALGAFLAGATEARIALGLAGYGPGDEDLLEDFGVWLKRRFRRRLPAGWFESILAIDPSEKNGHTFLRLFDEFLRTTGRDGEGLALDRDSQGQPEPGGA
jgi:hypothetical protein